MERDSATHHNKVNEEIAKSDAATPAPPRAERITLDNVEEAFTFQSWKEDQQDAGKAVREALVGAARVILNYVPESPLRTRALNNLVDARMLANAAITFKGRF